MQSYFDEVSCPQGARAHGSRIAMVFRGYVLYQVFGAELCIVGVFWIVCANYRYQRLWRRDLRSHVLCFASLFMPHPTTRLCTISALKHEAI